MFAVFEDSATGTIATIYLEQPEQPFDMTHLVRSECLTTFGQFLDSLLYKEPDNKEVQMLRRTVAIEEKILMEDVIYLGEGKTLMFNTKREREYLKRRISSIKKLYGKDCDEYRTTREEYKRKYIF